MAKLRQQREFGPVICKHADLLRTAQRKRRMIMCAVRHDQKIVMSIRHRAEPCGNRSRVVRRARSARQSVLNSPTWGVHGQRLEMRDGPCAGSLTAVTLAIVLPDSRLHCLRSVGAAPLSKTSPYAAKRRFAGAVRATDKSSSPALACTPSIRSPAARHDSTPLP
jgi:hypothetical protein